MHFFSREHGVFIREDADPEMFKTKVLHELFHYKGVNFLPIPLTETIVERLTAQASNLNNPSLKGSTVFNGIYTYPKLRPVLDQLLQKIRQKTGISDVKAFSYFAKAHLSGELEHLSFLDSCFSAGTCARLNQLDDDANSFIDFVNGLE